MRSLSVSVCVAAAIGALAVAGCGGGGGGSGISASGGTSQINVLSNFTPDVARGKVLDQLIAEFNREHAGKIKVVSKPQADWPTLQQKIKSMMSAGSTPDVFLYNYNPNDLTRENSGEMMDWSKYLDADPAWKARFRPQNLAAVTHNGQVVGIPSDQAPALFYYHKDLFRKAGISSFPKTWDEFFADAAKLKKSGVAPIALMTSDDAWHTMNAFSYLAVDAGGLDAYGPGHPLDSPAIKRAAADTKRLFSLTTQDAVGANYAVSSQNFLSGKAATVIDGPWLISSIAKLKNPCDVGVATAPTFGDGKVPAGTVVTDSLNVWGAAKQKNPAKTKAVVAWMKFLTSPKNAARMSVQGQYPLAVKSDLTSADYAKAGCQMGDVLKDAAGAPASVVQMGREIKPAAQEQLPSLLEGLATGGMQPASFAQQLQQANQ